MTELLKYATDDQIAFVFCGAALVISSAVMYFSHYAGEMQRARAVAQTTNGRTSSLPIDVDGHDQHEKAA